MALADAFTMDAMVSAECLTDVDCVMHDGVLRAGATPCSVTNARKGESACRAVVSYRLMNNRANAKRRMKCAWVNLLSNGSSTRITGR